MSEFKKGDKVLVEAEFREDGGSFSSGAWCYANGSIFSVKLNKIHPLPKKVVIPKFVAEWVEVCKEHLALNISSAMVTQIIWNHNQPSDLIQWMKKSKNKEIFARAWLDGYEVEKEKLYYVNIPNVYHGDFGYSETFDNYSFYNKNDATEIRFQLTEAEIKQDFDWAWKWAKEVE